MSCLPKYRPKGDRTDMHPILFHIGNFTVHTFGAILMVAFAVAVYRGFRAAEKREGSLQPGQATGADILDVSVFMILAGVFGARALFVALDWSQYSGRPQTWLAIWEGGISFHGALLGGILAMALFCRARKLSLMKLCDSLAPSVMIGYAIGRIGCFFNGCCYGIPTTMPWGVRFFDDGHWTPPSHPTQLYASAMSFLFFAILVRIERRQTYVGQMVGWYLIFAATERFIMEIWRAGVTSTIVFHGLTDTQILCLALAIFGTVLLNVTKHRAGNGGTEPPTHDRPTGMEPTADSSLGKVAQ